MIAVTGATGLTGRAIVERLSARGVPVRALVRNLDKARDLAALPRVELAQADLARIDTLVPALRGVARVMVISSSDPSMLDVQTNVVTASREAGVAHVVKLSGIGSEPTSSFRFARMHGEIERRIEASGLAFTHLRAGEFMHSYFRQVPAIVGKGILPLAMGDARIASIDSGDIAEAAVATLTGDGHAGKIYPITGPEALTMTEVAERLSRVTGKPIRYVDVPPEDARKTRLAAGMPPYLAEALDELFAERRKGVEATLYPTLERVFGIRPTRFDEFATRWAPVFRGEQPPPR
jgi:uncharacterized protein YbjT (DUF2867 family)